MSVSLQQKNQHLLWRAGFGPDISMSIGVNSMKTSDLWEKLKEDSQAPPGMIRLSGPAPEIVKAIARRKQEGENPELTKEERQKIRAAFRENVKELNRRWLSEMISSKAQLREKMALFWHGHFACRVVNSDFQQELLHTIRTNALENFGELLKAVSRTPAMIQFLNNQQNRKSHPNENFAREVMELFTLGRGNYSETDVKEAARAFTGWGFDLNGQFVFRKFQHDDGIKTVLGKTGNFDGNDVLNILLGQPQTAQFIARKIYRFLVNEKVDEKKLAVITDVFRKSGYEISALLDAIFSSDRFYDEQNIGAQIKSPVQLLAGIRRSLPMQLENESVQLLIQKILGQVLFFPPNVAGWPGGKSWIDSSTLMFRMQLPLFLASGEDFKIQPKSDDDVNMGQGEDRIVTRMGRTVRRGARANIQWEQVVSFFQKTKREDLLNAISKFCIQSFHPPANALIEKYTDSASRESFIKSALINFMSTPEYQLC
jgi:uncharacterized protein (DUF1800 family)